MKLIPKAKPVKIRVMSGGKEHSSVESLKQHFDIDDVKMLLDGRLARWLRQLGRNDLAASISEFSREKLDTKEGCLRFTKIFFGDELFDEKYSSLSELAVYWHLYKQNTYGTTCVTLLSCFLKFDKNEAKTLYKTEKNVLPPERWYALFSYFQQQENDVDFLYWIGCMLCDGDGVQKDNYEGVLYIKKAADLGNKIAKDFITEKVSVRFFNISEKDKGIILDNISDLFTKKVINLLYLRRRYSEPDIHQLCNFAEECSKAKSMWKGNSELISNLSVHGKYYMFYKEAVFILYFLKGKESLNGLKEIAPLYPPADFIVRNINKRIPFRDSFGDINFYNTGITDVIKFVFQHIFEY